MHMPAAMQQQAVSFSANYYTAGDNNGCQPSYVCLLLSTMMVLAGLNGLPFGVFLSLVCGAEVFSGNTAVVTTAVSSLPPAFPVPQACSCMLHTPQLQSKLLCVNKCVPGWITINTCQHETLI